MKSLKLITRPSKVNVTSWRRHITLAACIALSIGVKAHAGCSPYDLPKPTADADGPFVSHSARFMPAVFEENSASAAAASEPQNAYAIVGLWSVQLTAKGNAGIPDGTPIDFGYQTWHSDGTEILNSGMRPPLTSSFCMGVWQRVGFHHYVLNHVALSWDSSGTVYVGPGSIKEDVVANQSGNSFAGTFQIIQYATDGKTVLATVKGEVTGQRITAL